VTEEFIPRLLTFIYLTAPYTRTHWSANRNWQRPLPLLRLGKGAQTHGFGWNVKQDDSGKGVWQTGSTAGFRAFIERRLGEQSVVIMLTNVGNSKRAEINEAIRAILEGQSFIYPKKSSAVALYEVIHISGVDEAIKTYRDYKEQSADQFDLSESELNILGSVSVLFLLYSIARRVSHKSHEHMCG